MSMAWQYCRVHHGHGAYLRIWRLEAIFWQKTVHWQSMDLRQKMMFAKMGTDFRQSLMYKSMKTWVLETLHVYQRYLPFSRIHNHSLTLAVSQLHSNIQFSPQRPHSQDFHPRPDDRR